MRWAKWVYGVLSIIATVCLIVSFFQEVKAMTQISLLIQAVGFAFVSGFGVGSDWD